MVLIHYSWIPWRKAWHIRNGKHCEHQNGYWWMEINVIEKPIGWELAFNTPILALFVYFRHRVWDRTGRWTGLSACFIPTRWNLQLEETGNYHRYRFRWDRPAQQRRWRHIVKVKVLAGWRVARKTMRVS